MHWENNHEKGVGLFLTMRSRNWGGEGFVGFSFFFEGMRGPVQGSNQVEEQRVQGRVREERPATRAVGLRCERRRKARFGGRG